MNSVFNFRVAMVLAVLLLMNGCGENAAPEGGGSQAAQQSSEAAQSGAASSRSSPTANKLLAGYPALERSWFEKVQNKKAEFERSKPDREKMAALSEEYVRLEKEWGPAIENYTKAQGLVGVAVPFEPLAAERPFSIGDVTIEQALRGSLLIYVNMKLNEDLPEPKQVQADWLEARSPMRGGDEAIFRIWVKMVDSKGREIEGTKQAMRTLSAIKKDQLKQGLTFRMSRRFNTGEIILLDDFAKVVEITRAEFEAK